MKVCHVDESGNTAEDACLAFEQVSKSRNGRYTTVPGPFRFCPRGKATMKPDESGDRMSAASGTPIALFEDGKVIWVRVDEHDEG